MADKPLRRDFEGTEEETLHCDGRPRARFRTLFSRDRPATHSLTYGVAYVGPDSPLPLHRHSLPRPTSVSKTRRA